MAEWRYQLVNVFAHEGALSGNPLCVFEDAHDLDAATMQALALQFNLSETTFVLPSDRADARVRIFAPSGEMPFAGHPTLGTAAVVAAARGLGGTVRLEMNAGIVPVARTGEVWTFEAPPAQWRPAGASPAELAAMLGLEPDDLAPGAAWVSTGNEQLLVPLVSVAALTRACPVPALAARHGNDRGMVKIFCFAENASQRWPVRFFFEKTTGVIAEDPGTGSACANLGGWWLSMRRPLPLSLVLEQGDHLGRACRLVLSVQAPARIGVGGRVVHLGGGTLRLDD